MFLIESWGMISNMYEYLHIRKHMNYIYINPCISTCLKQNIDWLRTFPPNSFLPEPNKAPLRKQFKMYYFPSNTIKLLASQNIPFNNFN